MTCIAVVKHDDKVYMAGDRGASDDGTILALDAPKVWKIGPYLIGYAGAMDGERIRYNFKPTAPNIKDTDKFMLNEFTKALKEFYDEHFLFSTQDKEADFGMIIVVNGLMYEHDAGVMSMTRFATNHLSVGSGSEYAYGSLHSTEAWSDGKKRVRIAVDAATKYSTSCMGPIDVVEVLHTK